MDFALQVISSLSDAGTLIDLLGDLVLGVWFWVVFVGSGFVCCFVLCFFFFWCVVFCVHWLFELVY